MVCNVIYAVGKNVFGKSLQSQNDFIYLPLPNIVNLTSSRITYKTADKAGLLFDDSTLVGSQCLATLGGSASCYIHIANFFQTMPNTEKVSEDARGASDATANIRNHVVFIPAQFASKEDARRLVRRAITRAIRGSYPIYKVSLRTVGKWSKDYKSGIYYRDVYHASSSEEAIGMACEQVKAQFPNHAIIAGEIECMLLNID